SPENPRDRRSEPREPSPTSFELATGHFLVGAPTLRLGPELTRADFCASSLFAAATDFVVAEPERSWKLAQLVLCGQSFTTILRFRGEHLQRVDLMHDDPRYGSSWDDWTPALELERKAQHEAWLGQLFGAQREFAWGSVAQVQDAHYGTFAIVLRYRRA
ncbi:MAG: hypothetical protein JNM84_13475, partial [Planctomycetes bacterium]|nr:hypothetical protein [Planctomycetota bacterium]